MQKIVSSSAILPFIKMRRDVWIDKAGGRHLPVKQYYCCVRGLVGGRWNSDNNTSIITKVSVF